VPQLDQTPFFNWQTSWAPYSIQNFMGIAPWGSADLGEGTPPLPPPLLLAPLLLPPLAPLLPLPEHHLLGQALHLPAPGCPDAIQATAAHCIVRSPAELPRLPGPSPYRCCSAVRHLNDYTEVGQPHRWQCHSIQHLWSLVFPHVCTGKSGVVPLLSEGTRVLLGR
jgi:hypothetical protein